MDGDKTRVIRVLEIGLGLNPPADLSDTIHYNLQSFDTIQKCLMYAQKLMKKMLKCNKNVIYV